MLASWKSTRRLPLERIAFRNSQLKLEFNPQASLSLPALEAALKDKSLSVEKRILAAMGLSSRRRQASKQAIDVPCIDFGPAQILLLPAEAFVGFQLMAQKMRPHSFVVAIGYGECWPGYIPTESAFKDNFDDVWSWVSRGSEERVRDALERVLLPRKHQFDEVVTEGVRPRDPLPK